MKNRHKKEAVPAQTGSRYSELKTMLDERRRELQAEVQGKMRGVREEGSWGGKLDEVLDAVESAEADIQEDLEFALVQMKSETLNKVNDALVRLDQGSYGNCFDCGEEIAKNGCGPCPSPSVVRIAKRRGKLPSSASVSSPRVAHSDVTGPEAVSNC